MPAPILFPPQLGRELTRLRKAGENSLAAPGRKDASFDRI